MDHEPIKIIVLIIDIICSELKWSARHHTPAMVVAGTDSLNEVIVELEQLPGPIPPLDPEICVEILIISLFIIGIALVTSLKVLIMATLFLLEK